MRRLFPLLFLACSSEEAATSPSAPSDDGGAGHDGAMATGDSGVTDRSCLAPASEPAFAVSTTVTTRDPWVVVTGTAPKGFANLTVNGATRGVHADPARGVWSYVLQHAGGTKVTLDVAIDGQQKQIAVDVVDAPPLAARELAAGKHTVGAWMFPWFDGDASWDCVSPWRPQGGFVTWDGSVGWARKQILDQMDAHLDVVGLQFSDAAGGSWPNVVNVMKALRALTDEGFAPPRFFPFFDTIIWIERRFTENGGTPIDLSQSAGRADFYGNIGTWYATFATELGARDAKFANARMDGKPFVAMWHSSTSKITGVSTSASDAALNDAFFADLKARFVAQHGDTPWIVAHPNNWRHGTGADEITLMFGPPTHFSSQTYGARKPTVNIEAGFWNPISNTFYLPRSGGTHFADAWTSALGVRANADHLYIDSWNETGEGSGIFEAPPLTYTASTDGPCPSKPWANKHDDAWGPSARHYIDATRTNASAWNDVPDLDAEIVADDIPKAMKPGERRFVSVVVRNRGDETWSPGATPTMTSRAGSADFGVKDVSMTPDTARIRGYPAVYTFELLAPCETGEHGLVLGLAANGTAFGDALTRTITVSRT